MYFALIQSEACPVTSKSAIHVTPSEQRVFLLPSVNLEYYARNGLFESDLIEWSMQFCKKDRAVLDIGAHTGTYSIALAPHCKEVFAFEPQKNTYYALCGSVALSGLSDKITCVQMGLGSQDQVGVRTLNIVSPDGGGSTLHLGEHDRALWTETVQIHTLDSLMLDNIGFVKMDIEGNEMDAIRGGIETLRRSDFPPILLEVNTGASFERLRDFLRDIVGYRDLVRVSGTQNMALAIM